MHPLHHSHSYTSSHKSLYWAVGTALVIGQHRGSREGVFSRRRDTACCLHHSHSHSAPALTQVQPPATQGVRLGTVDSAWTPIALHCVRTGQGVFLSTHRLGLIDCLGLRYLILGYEIAWVDF